MTAFGIVPAASAAIARTGRDDESASRQCAPVRPLQTGSVDEASFTYGPHEWSTGTSQDDPPSHAQDETLVAGRICRIVCRYRSIPAHGPLAWQGASRVPGHVPQVIRARAVIPPGRPVSPVRPVLRPVLHLSVPANGPVVPDLPVVEASFLLRVPHRRSGPERYPSRRGRMRLLFRADRRRRPAFGRRDEGTPVMPSGGPQCAAAMVAPSVCPCIGAVPRGRAFPARRRGRRCSREKKNLPSLWRPPCREAGRRSRLDRRSQQR